MKHWQRFLGTIIALTTAALWFVFFQPEAGDDQKQRLADFSTLLGGVSHGWAAEDLDALMVSSLRDDAHYRPLLATARPLGRFVGCERLNLGDFADDALDQAPLDRLDATTVYQGNGQCAFEKGKARVLVGYVKQQGQPKLALLVIDDVSLFGATD